MAPVRICLFCHEAEVECVCDIDEPRAPRPKPDEQPPRCRHCLDNGMVCEDHPHQPFGVTTVDHPGACGAGMPCPACCSPVPADGTHSIAEAFTPDWMRK